MCIAIYYDNNKPERMPQKLRVRHQSTSQNEAETQWWDFSLHTFQEFYL